MRVAIQGIRGSYSYRAASILSPGASVASYGSFEEACESVSENKCDLAVLPVSNSLIGNIPGSQSAISEHALNCIDEYELEIDHVLAGFPGFEGRPKCEIWSHPAALSQCSRFLNARTSIKSVEKPDTAWSVRTIIRYRLANTAAICSKEAAHYYGARVLLEDIADKSGNVTKFQLLGRKHA